MSALPCLKGKRSCSVPATCRCEAAEWLMARHAINHSDYCGGTQIVHRVQGVKVARSHHTHTAVLYIMHHCFYGYKDTNTILRLKYLPSL